MLSFLLKVPVGTLSRKDSDVNTISDKFISINAPEEISLSDLLENIRISLDYLSKKRKKRKKNSS